MQIYHIFTPKALKFKKTTQGLQDLTVTPPPPPPSSAPSLSLSMYKIFQQRYLKNGRSDPSMNHLGTYVHTYKLMLQFFSFCPTSKI